MWFNTVLLKEGRPFLKRCYLDGSICCSKTYIAFSVDIFFTDVEAAILVSENNLKIDILICLTTRKILLCLCSVFLFEFYFSRLLLLMVQLFKDMLPSNSK